MNTELKSSLALHEEPAFLDQRWRLDASGRSVWAEIPWMDTINIPVPPETDSTRVTLEVCRISGHTDPKWKAINGRLLSHSLNMYQILKDYLNQRISLAEFENLSHQVTENIEQGNSWNTWSLPLKDTSLPIVGKNSASNSTKS